MLDVIIRIHRHTSRAISIR